MLPAEHAEPFTHKGRHFQAIFFEYDVRAEKSVSPGGRARAIRIQVDDDASDLLEDMDLISRVKTAKTYQVKSRLRSGVGITEIDLAIAQEKPFVRTY